MSKQYRSTGFRKISIALLVFLLASLACQTIINIPELGAPAGTPEIIQTVPVIATETPAALPPADTPETQNNGPSRLNDPDEPVEISGTIEYTSPFFINSIAEPFVLLEDQAGFVSRDREFLFAPASQTIGPVELIGSGVLQYTLALPSQPQGTQLDLDNDQNADPGVQVFAIAYWSNTWGDPFLEPRDGQGWSTAYASTIVDPEREDEITSGKLLIWAPDDQQAFPSGFGSDNNLFTVDDPVMDVPAGYSVIDLSAEPFEVLREPEPVIDLYEGALAVNDYSDLSYREAFTRLFEKASVEYPFTVEKNIDWAALFAAYDPLFQQVNDDREFYLLMREFLSEIPDGHVGITLDPQVFFEQAGGSFGMLLAELSDGRVIVSNILPGLPAGAAGIEPGAEILEWDGTPVSQALAGVQPFFGPYSTDHAKRTDQLVFLARVAPETTLDVTFQNPAASSAETVELNAEIEYQSLFMSLPDFTRDELALPIESEILDESGLGYIRINTFSDDYNLMARLWERTLEQLVGLEIPGLILDLRVNGGGNSGLARDFAGYFFDRSFELYRRFYYNENTEQFEESDPTMAIEPAPEKYSGMVAVLVSPDCVSACEGFVYALTRSDNVIVVGHQPSAGAFGEVGRGQYTLPGGYDVQFPTGRSETLDGDLLLEGTGIVLDLQIPVTEKSILENVDTVLEAAVSELIERINSE